MAVRNRCPSNEESQQGLRNEGKAAELVHSIIDCSQPPRHQVTRTLPWNKRLTVNSASFRLPSCPYKTVGYLDSTIERNGEQQGGV